MRNPAARLTGFSPRRGCLPDQGPSSILIIVEIESDAAINSSFASRGYGMAFRRDHPLQGAMFQGSHHPGCPANPRSEVGTVISQQVQ